MVLNSFLTACRHFAFWIAFLGGIWCGGFFLFWCFVFGAARPPPPELSDFRVFFLEIPCDALICLTVCYNSFETNCIVNIIADQLSH